jgi:hypothetical protein
MNEGYKYKKVDIKDFNADLRQLGDEGWEVVEIPQSFLSERWMRVRCVVSGLPQSASWQYRLFGTTDVPKDWWDHIRSYGWTMLEPPYVEHHYLDRSSITRRVHLAKRLGSSKDAEDGDIIECLRKLGYSVKPFETNSFEIIAEILKIKWELSQQRGSDVGTYGAVRHWLARNFLPKILGRRAVLLSEFSPESILDELLSFRETVRGGTDGLNEVLVWRWWQHMKGEIGKQNLLKRPVRGK